jgi:hypothetical protein
MFSLIAAIVIVAATTIIWVAQMTPSPLLQRPTNLNEALEYLKSGRGGPEGDPRQIGAPSGGIAAVSASAPGSCCSE